MRVHGEDFVLDRLYNVRSIVHKFIINKKLELVMAQVETVDVQMRDISERFRSKHDLYMYSLG